MHLVRKTVSLLPPLCPVAKGKRVMFVFLLEVLNEDSHGLPGRSPGPLAFFDSLKNPSPRAPKKATASHGVSAPTPPVSHSGAPLPGLRVGGKPEEPRTRGVKTKKTLLKPGLSREAREAIRHAVASQPGHPLAESLHPPLGQSALDPIPSAPPVASGSGPRSEERRVGKEC